MASDSPELLQAFFTKGAFRSSCPACMDAHDFAPTEFHPAKKTIPYTCPCGRSYNVLPLGLRAGMRKTVKLPGVLSCKHGTSLLKFPCLVRDLSANGIGVTLDMTRAELADTMHLRVRLDDSRRTALLLPCKVRRRQEAGTQLLLGLQFESLDPDTQSKLVRYLSQ